MQKDANLVELEKCCQTHIFLQNFVSIQPRTSPPKICQFSQFCGFSEVLQKGVEREKAEEMKAKVEAAGGTVALESPAPGPGRYDSVHNS